MPPHNPAAPLRALYRVFVLPALSNPTINATRTRAIPSLPWTARPFTSTPSHHAKTRPAEQRHQKWDSEITSPMIYLVDPVTNSLSPPRTRFDILNTLNKQTHRLIQLSPDEPHNPSFIPVCKIVSKKEIFESEKRRKIQAKEAKKSSIRGSEAGMKTLELNWAIDKGDLGHRLDRLRSFLGEGRRVEVCFAAKKRGRKASMEECEELIGRVREAAMDIEGVRDRGGLEGKIGRMASLEFIPKSTKGGSGGGGGGKAVDDDGDGGEALKVVGQA